MQRNQALNSSSSDSSCTSSDESYSGYKWNLKKDENNYFICTLESQFPIERLIIKKLENENQNQTFRITLEVNQEIVITDKRPGSFPYEFINDFYQKAGNKVQRGTVFECDWFMNTYDAKKINSEIAGYILAAIHDNVPFSMEQKADIFNFISLPKPKYEQARLFAPIVTQHSDRIEKIENDAALSSANVNSGPR